MEIEEKEIMKKIREKIAEKKVLEIGCGRGDYTKKLFKERTEYYAIDLSLDRLGDAKEKIIGPHFQVMNVEKLEFTDNFFEVIICANSFHEFPQEIQNRALEEILRVCKGDGLLIFIDPTEESATNKLWKPFDPNEDHAQRIANSNEKIFKLVNENKSKLVEDIKFIERHEFESKEKMYETMLTWWDDIKIPKNEDEKQQMLKEIREILVEEGFISSYLNEESRLIILKVIK